MATREVIASVGGSAIVKIGSTIETVRGACLHDRSGARLAGAEIVDNAS